MDIRIKNIDYVYQKGSPFERRALHNVSVSVPKGSYAAIIGHTGSGKSTLLQHLNGLLIPSSGTVSIGDTTINPKTKEKHLKPIRQHVGIVFQFPEYQLFEETVEKDICFGPINFGVSEEEATKRANYWLKRVGLGEEIAQKSPFELSGGQMRRVAIAGVLAMNPDVLVLDEPIAGLDPRGREEIMDLFEDIRKEHGITIILVTHSMEDAAEYAENLVLLNKGKVVMQGTPREVFSQAEQLAPIGLSIPEVVRFQKAWEKKSGIPLDKTCLTIEELVDAVSRQKRGEVL